MEFVEPRTENDGTTSNEGAATSEHASSIQSATELDQQGDVFPLPQSSPPMIASMASSPQKQQKQRSKADTFRWQSSSPTAKSRTELASFINEPESRALVIFHSPQASTVDVHNACCKFGALYYIRPEFHDKGVTLISYFDLRNASAAHASLCDELGPYDNAIYYSVMLHVANSNTEEFRLVVQHLPEGDSSSEARVESIFSG